MVKMESVVLNNQVKIPILGLGTWKIQDGDEVKNAVLNALEIGYRHIDTAKAYHNESGVGEAIRQSGLSREEVFVTTKLWNDDQGYESALKAFQGSLERLGLDYVDLYLIHWPFNVWETKTNKRKDSWQALEKLYEQGKVKAIGVSNFTIKHLQEMKSYAKVLPMVNQFEMHPFFYQPELLQYCSQNNIVVEAYSPLAQGKKMIEERVTEIAKKYGKSNAQILLRWGLQHGAVVIPKSSNKQRLLENSQIFDFEISADDIKRLDALSETHKLTTWDPELVP